MSAEQITWVDSFAKQGWASKEEYLEKMRANYQCVSTGTLLDEDENRVTLVLTTGEDAANQAITIPKSCIVDRQELVIRRKGALPRARGFIPQTRSGE